MRRKYVILVLVLLIFILAGGVYFWKNKTQKKVTGVVGPIESTQSANPYDKTNPFSNIKTNPFE